MVASSESRLDPRSFWRWVIIGTLTTVLVVFLALMFAIYYAEPILRARVIQTLSAKFKSRVELAAFHVSVHEGFQVSGNDLRIYGESDPNIHQPGVQPLIGIAEFRFRAGLWSLLRTPMQVDRVHVRGLSLNIPPKNERQQLNRMRIKSGKAKVNVHEFVCDHAQLVINTSQPGKLPLVFDIQNLDMRTTSAGKALQFEADLSNPKPVGMIHSVGYFGPWQENEPRDTPLEGDYKFSNADLSTIKGIAGILSSTGHYAGTLENITVDGTTKTPDFRIARSGHAVPLNTEFHAIVDATSGDTFLKPVNAQISATALTASGFIVRQEQPAGHWVELDVRIGHGRIDDLLRLGVKTDPPVMTGTVQLNTKFDLPPGGADLSDRLKLDGNFEVSGAHFTSDKLQQRVGALSLRSRGQPKLAKTSAADEVLSELRGTFRLRAAVLSFSHLQFEVPGAKVTLNGKYSLDGNEFNFHGKARMLAKLSHMTTGWKSVLLKPVDPFFSKNGAGTEFPVKVTGTKSEPHFGLDFGHKQSEN